MHKVFLGIGGNLGDKKKNLQKCIELIREKLGEVEIISSVYETPPWGFSAESNFWNQVILIDTHLDMLQLLQETQKIEGQFKKRQTSEGYSSREMDIDILFFDHEIIEASELIIPHPLLHKRNFVLAPLAEIAGEFIHPVLSKKIDLLLDECKDDSPIFKI